MSSQKKHQAIWKLRIKVCDQQSFVELRTHAIDTVRVEEDHEVFHQEIAGRLPQSLVKLVLKFCEEVVLRNWNFIVPIIKQTLFLTHRFFPFHVLILVDFLLPWLAEEKCNTTIQWIIFFEWVWCEPRRMWLRVWQSVSVACCQLSTCRLFSVTCSVRMQHHTHAVCGSWSQQPSNHWKEVVSLEASDNPCCGEIEPQHYTFLCLRSHVAHGVHRFF